MNELYKLIPRWDAWFELHDTAYLGKTARVEDPQEPERHVNWLRAQAGDKPIYMLKRWADIPASVAYPIDAMTERFGRYFTSTVGYMLALAIARIVDARQDPKVAEPGEWIGLYGIDLASDTEYLYQRPNAEYFIGLARGLGIEVSVPETAAVTHAAGLYGFEPPPQEAGLISDWFLRSELRKMREKADAMLAHINTLDGVMQAYGFLVEQWEAIHAQADPKAVVRHLLDEKRTAHGQASADWNVVGGVVQAYTFMLQVMEFKRRGVYVPETDPHYVPPPSTSGEEAQAA